MNNKKTKITVGVVIASLIAFFTLLELMTKVVSTPVRYYHDWNMTTEVVNNKVLPAIDSIKGTLMWQKTDIAVVGAKLDMLLQVNGVGEQSVNKFVEKKLNHNYKKPTIKAQE